MKKLIPYLIGAGFVALTVTMLQWSNNSVDIMQAQAAIEAARAAQDAAQAAKVAAGGLADVARLNAFLLVVIVVLGCALAGALGYLWFVRQQIQIQEQRAQVKHWLPGPNAGWRKHDELPRPTPQAVLPAGDLISQLVALTLAEKLGAMQRGHDIIVPQHSATALPAETDDGWGEF